MKKLTICIALALSGCATTHHPNAVEVVPFDDALHAVEVVPLIIGYGYQIKADCDGYEC